MTRVISPRVCLCRATAFLNPSGFHVVVNNTTIINQIQHLNTKVVNTVINEGPRTQITNGQRPTVQAVPVRELRRTKPKLSPGNAPTGTSAENQRRFAAEPKRKP